MEIQKIKGLIAAPYTPMNGDGSLNTGLIPAYATKLKNDGVSGVFICGTTGEGMLMTPEERTQVADKWISEQTEEFKIIVHVGTTSSKLSKQLAQHAQSAGAFATGCMGPVFLSTSDVQLIAEFCAEVASGAPDLPFYYYHIPSVSGVNVRVASFIRVAQKIIPNLAGIKFTDNNFMDMQQCLDMDDNKWDILHGYDELLLAGLTFGAKGAVGSTYNYMAPLYRAIIEDFEKGDLFSARRKQLLSIKVVEILNKYDGAIVAGKALMKAVGLDCGPCRLPVKNLSRESYTRFIKEFERTYDLLTEQFSIG